MSLFKESMSVYKEMCCECCDRPLSIHKLQKPKMKKIVLKMEKLLNKLKFFYNKNENLKEIDKGFDIQKDDPDFFKKDDQGKIDELVNSIFYYSDRWSYSRYRRTKDLWNHYVKIQKKYQKNWDLRNKSSKKKQK